MRIVCGAVLALSLVAGGARAGAADECLAITRGASPVIEAMVQGQGPFSLVLDTAASGSTLDEETVARLKLPRDAETETAQGMGGPTDVRLYRLGSMSAGPLTLTDVTVPGLPGPEIEGQSVVGLAGIDLFGSALAVWTANGTCVEVKASGALPGADWRRVDVKWTRAWKIMLPIRIGGVDGWGLLDTGAQYTVLNPVFAERLGLTQASGRLREGGEIWGIDGRALPLSLAEVEDVKIGQWSWARQTLKVGAMPVFGRLGDASEPLAIIGWDWLADRSFAIDYGAQAVWQGAAR